MDVSSTIETLEVYPNPATTGIFVKANSDGVLCIITPEGKFLLSSFQLTQQRLTEISLESFPRGIYVLKFQPEKGNPIIKKVILQ